MKVEGGERRKVSQGVKKKWKRQWEGNVEKEV